MNVLIVDDDEHKRDVLRKYLVEVGVPADHVFTASCAREGRDAVTKRRYELLLIDLILPASTRGEPRADVGFELLQEFVESAAADRIVGTTAHLDALDTYAEEFRQLAEQLLLVDGVNEEWRESLKSLVLQITSRRERPQLYDADFCLISAVRATEYRALLDLPVAWSAEKVLSGGALFRQGAADVAGQPRKGICAHAKQMGMVSACHLAQSLIHEFRPRVLIMTGICGGLPGETALGDLVIADKSWDWQSGKYTADKGFMSAPDQKDASQGLVAHAKAVEAEATELLKELVTLRSPGRVPTFVDGPMLSGSSVVATDDLHSLFISQHRKPVAIDMECYGVYYACRMAGAPAPDFLCLKSVSDMADSAKGDDFQAFCSALSAKVAWRVLERHFATS